MEEEGRGRGGAGEGWGREGRGLGDGRGRDRRGLCVAATRQKLSFSSQTRSRELSASAAAGGGSAVGALRPRLVQSDSRCGVRGLRALPCPRPRCGPPLPASHSLPFPRFEAAGRPPPPRSLLRPALLRGGGRFRCALSKRPGRAVGLSGERAPGDGRRRQGPCRLQPPRERGRGPSRFCFCVPRAPATIGVKRPSAVAEGAAPLPGVAAADAEVLRLCFRP